jgi:hypothetical protein
VYLTYEIASVVYLLYHCGWWVMRMGMCSDWLRVMADESMTDDVAECFCVEKKKIFLNHLRFIFSHLIHVLDLLEGNRRK